jgi:hypothetical protein
MPHHLMKPKAGDCVVLMRNPKKRSDEWTRLVVKTLHQKLYHCRWSNKVKPLSIIILTTNEVKAVIADVRMMITKLRRESFYHLGIYMLEAVFGHGHLYSVLTGRRNHQNVNIHVRDKYNQGKCFHD